MPWRRRCGHAWAGSGRGCPSDVELMDENMLATTIKSRLYDQYRVEVPIMNWNGRQFVRVAVQGYNKRENVEALVEALGELLRQMTGR